VGLHLSQIDEPTNCWPPTRWPCWSGWCWTSGFRKERVGQHVPCVLDLL